MDRAELKALIREVLAEVEQDRREIREAAEYYTAEAAERKEKRDARAKADAEDERRRLEDRVYDLERTKRGGS